MFCHLKEPLSLSFLRCLFFVLSFPWPAKLHSLPEQGSHLSPYCGPWGLENLLPFSAEPQHLEDTRKHRKCRWNNKVPGSGTEKQLLPSMDLINREELNVLWREDISPWINKCEFIWKNNPCMQVELEVVRINASVKISEHTTPNLTRHRS